MENEEPTLQFEEDFLRSELFSFAAIPEAWHEGDFIAELDHHEILYALNEAADYVDEDTFEDGMPGMSGAYYRIYAADVEAFRKKLTRCLLLLLETTFGKNREQGSGGND